MSVYELAKLYHPRLWDKSRLEALVEAGRLSQEQMREIIGGLPIRTDDNPNFSLKGGRL